jgi:hypothetical protein
MIAPDRTYDPVRFHRGTRGFASFLTGLNGFVVLGAALFVVPTLGVDEIVARWAVILGITAGIASFVAIAGLIRGRRWGATLVAYLAATGIGISTFGALVALTGIAIFGASTTTAFGFFAWMIGTWAIAARYALKPFSYTPQARRVSVPVARPVADARPSTGARKRTATRSFVPAAA